MVGEEHNKFSEQLRIFGSPTMRIGPWPGREGTHFAEAELIECLLRRPHKEPTSVGFLI